MKIQALPYTHPTLFPLLLIVAVVVGVALIAIIVEYDNSTRVYSDPQVVPVTQMVADTE